METRSLCLLLLLLLWWLINCFVVNEKQADHGIRIHFAQDPPDQFYKEERAVTTKAPEEEEDDVDDDVLGSLNLLANFRSGGGFCCCGCCVPLKSYHQRTRPVQMPSPFIHRPIQSLKWCWGAFFAQLNKRPFLQAEAYTRSKTEKYTSQSCRSLLHRMRISR